MRFEEAGKSISKIDDASCKSWTTYHEVVTDSKGKILLHHVYMHVLEERRVIKL